ncbi:MAG TPA: metallophosphoesterase family protein [Candidatus Limiplasma sp.]|nr:metallophosphoesterase family protein [Candidatus Limiplasma sp.]
MQIALIADLHGNWPATQALERDLAQRRVDKLYCLGDIVGKGPSSDRTFDWAVANCDLILGGNWDYGVGYRQYAPDAYYWGQLGEKRLQTLRNLPLEKTLTLSGRHIRLFHGRPIMKTLILAQQDIAGIEPLFTDCNGFRCDVVGYADAHRQALRTLNPGLFFNCGSVGNALGTPVCCYAILEGAERDPDASLDIRLITRPYDRAKAVEDARVATQVPLIDTFIREVQTGQYSR